MHSFIRLAVLIGCFWFAFGAKPGEFTAKTVVYDEPTYDMAPKRVVYDPPPVYYSVPQRVVYEPPPYMEMVAPKEPVYAVAETVMYDKPVYEEPITLEMVAPGPDMYNNLIIEEPIIMETVVVDAVAPIVAYAVAPDVAYSVAYDPVDYDTSEIGTTPNNDIGYMKLLFRDFIEGSDPNIRPVVNQSEAIHVHSKFVPLNIVRFDTTTQRFSLLAYFRVFWRDEFCNWLPKDYNGLYVMKVPTTDIWKPALIIQKPFDGDGAIGEPESDIASISWLGDVQWVPDGTYSVVCEVNIQYYPFDEQVCTVSYYMADESYRTLNLTHDAEVDTSEMSENSAWEVTKLTVKTYINKDAYYVDVDFHLRRRPNFTAFTLIMPLLMLAFLNVCVFLVPADSGEKGGFAITVFLSYGIFICIISDQLPNNSIQTSYFIIFITLLLVLSVLSVFYVVIQSKMIACMGVKESLIKCFIPEFMKGKEKVNGAQRSMNQFLNASTPAMKGKDAATAWKLIFHKIDMVIFFSFLVIALLSTTTFFCILLKRVSESDLNITG